jgi:hypothetical protein
MSGRQKSPPFCTIQTAAALLLHNTSSPASRVIGIKAEFSNFNFIIYYDVVITFFLINIFLRKLLNGHTNVTYFGYSIKENIRGSSRRFSWCSSQSYVKYNLRKNKIVVASTTDFFRY